MARSRRRSSPIFVSAIAVLLLVSSLAVQAIDAIADEEQDQDLEELQQLLAIEEEEEDGIAGTNLHPEVVKKAQGIVFELSNDNAMRIIEGNEYVLVLGYAPWCPRSAELMPRFAKAATRLKEMGSSLAMAKLDAERHTKAASILGIKGSPSLVFFVNGTAQPYDGGLAGEEIVIWARKKTGAPVIRLLSISSAKEFLELHQIFIVGFFKNFEGPEYEEFIKAAVAEPRVQFAEVNDLSVAQALSPGIIKRKHFLGLIKSEPETFSEFVGIFKEGEILRFIELNKFPLVTTLTELNSATVFSSPMNLQLFLFAEEKDFKSLHLSLQDAARKYKTKIMFIHADIKDDNLAKPFLTLFGVEADKPVVAAFDSRSGSKYLLELDYTPANLEDFCDGLVNGTALPYFKSEPLPQITGVVQKIVGRNFGPVILESSENVFLEVYSPWCIDCEATSKQIEKLAEHFQGVGNLIFGRIDASLNEHPKLQVVIFPTLLFYPSGNKSYPVKVSKKASFEALVAFVNKYVGPEAKGLSSEQPTKDEL